MTVVGERATRVHRLDGRAWTAVAEVAADTGRLHRCGQRMCLLGPAGERLWRLPIVAGTAVPPAE